jgi:hypothetical protein
MWITVRSGGAGAASPRRFGMAADHRQAEGGSQAVAARGWTAFRAGSAGAPVRPPEAKGRQTRAGRDPLAGWAPQAVPTAGAQPPPADGPAISARTPARSANASGQPLLGRVGGWWPSQGPTWRGGSYVRRCNGRDRGATGRAGCPGAPRPSTPATWRRWLARWGRRSTGTRRTVAGASAECSFILSPRQVGQDRSRRR